MGPLRLREGVCGGRIVKAGVQAPAGRVLRPSTDLKFGSSGGASPAGPTLLRVFACERERDAVAAGLDFAVDELRRAHLRDGERPPAQFELSRLDRGVELFAL